MCHLMMKIRRHSDIIPIMQQEFGGLPGSPQPPSTGGTILQSDHDASVLVKPNASDIFFAVAAGAVGAVSSSCGETPTAL